MQFLQLARWEAPKLRRMRPYAATGFLLTPQPLPGSQPAQCCSLAVVRAATLLRSGCGSASTVSDRSWLRNVLSLPDTRFCGRPGTWRSPQKIVVRVEEEAEPRSEFIYFESAAARPLHIFHAVVKRECQLL